MSAENCDFKRKPCPGQVTTPEGQASTWSTIKRLKGKSAVGHSFEFIFNDTTDKTVPLSEIARRYSEDTILGIIPRPSCGTCTSGIQEVVDHITQAQP